jgi:nitric oxide reductase NorQ protein
MKEDEQQVNKCRNRLWGIENVSTREYDWRCTKPLSHRPKEELMSIAILVESLVEDSAKAQTLLIPASTEILMFHRVTTGSRGRGQTWQPLTVMASLPYSGNTTEPRGVIITERDVANARIGNVTNLATKLMSIPAVSVSAVTQSHYEAVDSLFDRLANGDSTLNDYVVDGRRSNPVMLSPIAFPTYQAEQELEAAFIPALAPEPTVTPNNVVALPQTHQEVELAKVPDERWAKEYLNRKMFGMTDFELLDIIKEKQENLIIRGGAGSGKTMLALAWASARGYRYYNVSSNVGLEPSHLFGMWIPTNQAGVFKWQDGPVTDLVRHGGVLLLNEIDFMPERITTVLFGLLDARREIQLLENGGEVIKAHPDLIVIGDHNPNYRGSRPMNQAWKDRFHHKWEFDYDKAIEKKLVKNEALLEIANQLRTMAYKGDIDTPISTRSLVAFAENCKNISLDYAISVYVNGFLDDEREAVKVVLETAKVNIARGFGIVIEVDTEIDEQVAPELATEQETN